LIDDLLKLSQINQLKLYPTTIDLSALANTVANRLLQLFASRTIEFSIAPNLLIVGDKSLVEIMLNNLLENAVKFTSKQPVAKINLYQQTAANGGAFVLQDNGAGFDMAAAKKLFGAFQRLHHQSDFEGTGIGLATVQRIVNLHGGKIWAHAAPGQGASFYFTF
jgi:signal transduction histidine kinase